MLLDTTVDSNQSSVDEFSNGVNPTIAAALTIVRICLTVCGLVTNTVTGVVLTNRKLWSPTSMLLLSLVAYDAVFLLASIPPCLMDVTKNAEAFAILLGVCYPLRYMAQTGSIYTTVTVTIERCLIVIRPLRARSFCTFGKTRKVILGVFLFSLIFNIPRCFFYKLFTQAMVSNNSNFAGNSTWLHAFSANQSSNVIPELSNTSDQSGFSNHSSQPVSNQNADWAYYAWLYLRVYELYVSSAFFYFLPYTLILILNMQLLLAIKKRRKETRRISVKNEHQVNYTKPTDLEDGLTLIVLGITVCFFFCCLTPAIYNVTQIAEVSNTELSQHLLTASDTMLCINASMDFFFYCLLGRKFRNIFLHLFCRRPYLRSTYSMSSSHCKAGHSISETLYHSV
ncbi:unnamed protein product [Candidula unifasciata]|uniref:G-protein coupled receptors family 1 profile domain-containing protein n=1 Tax=Candidula unifasciata TaxID=100452 RepID=A0A8S3YXA0_9EUPU|nr:unnamed protein product [Candidula unifasciata]